MQLSLNPTLTQQNDKKTDIKLSNQNEITANIGNNANISQTQQETQQLQSQVTTTPTQPDKNNENDIFNTKEYESFVRSYIQAQEADERLNQNKYLRELKQGHDGAFSKQTKAAKEGIWEHIKYQANPMNLLEPIRGYMDSSQKEVDAINHDKTILHDFYAKYGKNGSFNFQNIDKDELEKAKLRISINNKDISQLNDKEKELIFDNETLAGKLWDTITFKSDKEKLKDRQQNLTRDYVNADLVNDLVKLEGVTHSILDILNSDETTKEKKEKFLKDATKLAKKYGYDYAGIDKKTNKLAVFKDGKAYYPNAEAVFKNFDKILVNNFNDIVLSMIPIGAGANTALKAGKIATPTLAQTAGMAGAVSLVASPLDYVAVNKDIDRETSFKEGLDYAVSNALASTAGTLAIGGAIKGISKLADIKDLKLSDLKVKNILDNEEMAIHRKLNKFSQKELQENYANFKNIQSNIVISKDIRPQGMIGDFIDKIQDYNFLSKFSSKKESQERLLSSIFSNKELSKEFAGQLSSEEAQIIHKAVSRMGDNFTKLSKEYEQELINEYVRSGKTHLDSIPAIYKDMLQEIDKEAKHRYARSINNLQDNLRDIDFKQHILQSYKNITDKAIDELGLDSQLTNTLIRETQRLESREAIRLNEAIELRKDINEIIRAYDKKGSDLKKFRANTHLEAMKQSIDDSIANALNAKVANNTLDSIKANELMQEFINANSNYAKLKEALNDKFAKAITKGMSKKDLDSRLTTEQWKQRVLDIKWGDSIKGLENTIFKNFNPKMQEHTQMLSVLRALDRNIKSADNEIPIDFSKILNDIEELEKLTLSPKIYPVLDLFKNYAKAYQFSQDIAHAKTLQMMHGGGALATTLEGRIKVFLTNRLFKKLFAYIPIIGDNNAILNVLGKAIKDLKYPSEITLETIKQLRDADIKKGHAPNITNKDNARFSSDIPLSDKELNERIKGSNKRILDKEGQEELEALASNPMLLQAENANRYNEALKQTQENINTNLNEIRQDIIQGNFIASNDIKSNNNILQEALNAKNFTYTPDYAVARFDYDGRNYSLTINRNSLAFINDETKQITPRSYDELQALNIKTQNDFNTYKQQLEEVIAKKQERAELESNAKQTFRDITQEITEQTIKEINPKEAISKLNTIQGQNIPKQLDIDGFLKTLDNIDNKENFIAHLQKKQDAQSRLAYLNLVEPTLKEWDLQLTNGNRKELIKVFNDGNNFFTLLITEENDKRLITFLPKARMDYIEKKINNADLIQTFTSRASNTLDEWTRNTNSTPNKQTTQQLNKDLELTQTLTPQLQHKISQKQVELEKIQEKLAIQTTKKGKNYFTNKINSIQQEIKDLEIQAGIRIKDDIKATSNIKELATNEYIVYDKNDNKIILNQNEVKDILQALDLRDLKDSYIIKNKELSKFANNNNIYLDIASYIKSANTKEARDIANIKPILENFDIALKDTNNEMLLYKQRDNNTKLASVKIIQDENDRFSVRANDSINLNQIQDKIQAGAKVLISKLDSIKDIQIKRDEAIPYKAIRETTIQTEKMQEAINADYVVIKKHDIKPNFNSQTGLQYRDIKQDDVINDIANNLQVSKLIYNEGGFNGLPLIKANGEVIAGNHRSQALLNLSKTSRDNYIKAIKERFNIDLADDEIVVRRISDSVSDEKILQLAKLSNEGLENTLQEAVFTKLAKYENNIRDLDTLEARSLDEMKNMVNAKLKGNPTSHAETNLALLVSQMKDKEGFTKALSNMMKKDESIYNMLIDNAGSFFNVNKQHKGLDINEILQDSIMILSNARSDTRKEFKELADEFEAFLHSKNKAQQQEFLQTLGLDSNPIIDFKKKILGLTLKRYTINNTNPSEHLFNKIRDFETIARDIKQGNMFDKGREVRQSDFITHLYSQVADTRSDIAFLLKIADNMQDIEKGKITLDSISDKNIREYIQNLDNKGAVNKENANIETKANEANIQETKELETPQVNDNIKHTQTNTNNVDTKETNTINEINTQNLASKDNEFILDKLDSYEYIGKDGASYNLKEATLELRDLVVKEAPNDKYSEMIRNYIQEALDIKPIKEFGTNYAEHYHSPQTALQKLLVEKQGQVAGAFYRKELGDIDLVWGEVTNAEKHTGYGLSHILDKRKAEFMQQGLNRQEAEAKAVNLVNKIPNIIENGKIIKDDKGRLRLEYENQVIGLKDNYKGNPTNKWIVTSYELKENGESLYTSSPITKGETLPLNSNANSTINIPTKELEKEQNKQIIKEAKEKGLSVKETKELINNNKANKENTQTLFNDATQEIPQIINKEINNTEAKQTNIESKVTQDTILDIESLRKEADEARQFIKKHNIKEHMHLFHKPKGLKQLEIKYFNQEIPQEYKDILQGFPRAYEQEVANNLKTYLKDTDRVNEINAQIIDLRDKGVAMHFFLSAQFGEITGNDLRKLGFKPIDETPHSLVDANDPNYKKRFIELVKKLKNGMPQELSEVLAICKTRNEREVIQDALNIKPIKEFGINYAEHYHSPQTALQKLLAEKQGQVAGAFYRKELGDIDLVWGDSKKGLAHILERRTDDFMKKGFSKEEAEAKALEFIKEMPNIIEKGMTDKKQNRAFIDTQTDRVLIALDYKGRDKKWIVTAYKFYDDLNSADTHQVKHNINTSSVSRVDADNTNYTTKETIKQDIPTQAKENIQTLSKEAHNYAQSILKGLEKTANTPLEVLMDSVKSINRKFQKRQAQYIKQEAQNLLDNFSNIGINDIGSAINIAKIPFANDEIIKELKNAIKTKEFKKLFETTKTSTNTPTQQKTLFETPQKQDINTDIPAKDKLIQAYNEIKHEYVGIDPIATTHKTLVNLRKIWRQESDKAREQLINKIISYGIDEDMANKMLQSLAFIHKNHTINPDSQGLNRLFSTLKESIEKGYGDEAQRAIGNKILENRQEFENIINSKELNKAYNDYKNFETFYENSKNIASKEYKQVIELIQAYQSNKAKDNTQTLSKELQTQEPQANTINDISNTQTLFKDIQPQQATLSKEFANANELEKIDIIKRELEKQNDKLETQKQEFERIIQAKDYTDIEIKEVMDYIKENHKDVEKGFIYIKNPDNTFYKKILKNDPQEQITQLLELKLINDKIEPIEKLIAKNKKDIRTLEWDYKHLNVAGNKARFEKNLNRLEKALIKAEKDYYKSFALTYDLNTKEGYDKVRGLFYSAKNINDEQKSLFEAILPIAKKLNVNVRNAIRDPYEVLDWDSTKNISGRYYLNDNSARVKHSIGNKDEKAQTLLHELIHSVTSRAMFAYEKGQKHLLNQQQIRAIENINDIYKQIFEKRDELGLKSYSKIDGDYGLKNAHEMIAELSNPAFVEKLKKINIFDKLIDKIVKLIVSAKELVGLKKSNAYDKLKDEVKNIIQNYKDDFTQQYEKQSFRDFSLDIIAGEKALSNEYYSPQKERLAKAKELEANNISNKEIWDKTGWYKDKDSKWKFEINAKGGDIDTKAIFQNKENYLVDILKDEALFSAYPELKNLVVGLKDLGKGISGAYGKNDTHKAIALSKDIKENEIKQTLYHELQHAVQDIEGFAKGGNTKNLDIKDYERLLGEVEARNVENRMIDKHASKVSYDVFKEYPSVLSDDKYNQAIAKKFNLDYERFKNIDTSNLSDREFFIKYIQDSNNKKLDDKELRELYNEYLKEPIPHPHETMDTDIKDTIINHDNGVMESKELENSFLDGKNNIDLSKVNAKHLPKANFKNTKEFSNLFTNKQGRYGIITTPIKDIKVDIPYAYKHFYKNTYNTNREHIKGAFFDTLQKPMFIAQQETDRGLSTYFYKAYKYNDNTIGIFGIGIDNNGLINFKTLYEDNNNKRLMEMLRLSDDKIKYIDKEQLRPR